MTTNKQTLADKKLDYKELHSGYLGLFNKKDVKEKIQNVQRRLKELFKGIEQEEWFNQNCDKILNEEIGKELLK